MRRDQTTDDQGRPYLNAERQDQPPISEMEQFPDQQTFYGDSRGRQQKKTSDQQAGWLERLADFLQGKATRQAPPHSLNQMQ